MQKIFDSELKLMELIWEREPVSAKDLSILAATALEWNKNTTYTVLKKLEAKGFILRKDPGFICSTLVTRGEVQKSEAKEPCGSTFRRLEARPVLCPVRGRGADGRRHCRA